MSPPLTLETRLILACARTDPDVQRIRELVARGPNWRGILRKAERWGLVPLVYASLRQAAPSDHVPRSVADSLRHLYRRDTIHGIAQREVLRATLLRLSEARVPAIVLRGAALAALVYPSPTLRPIGDVDLLVRGCDQGWVDELLRGVRDAAQAIPHLGPGGLSLFDVRDHICSPGGCACRPAAVARIPIEDVWERARPAQIESVATLALSPEDLLLHLAIHLVTHLSQADGFGGHVRTLCDIGETCRRFGDAIDWQCLVTRAEAYDVAKPLYYALHLARDLVGAGVPSGALTDLRASFGPLPLEDRFLAAVAREAILSEHRATDPRSTFHRLGVHLLVTRRARDGAVLAGRLLARSSRVRLRRLGVGLAESTHPQAAQCKRLIHTPGEVAVTYDQEGASDGVDTHAQLRRTYGLYALSRALGVKYVHTPLGRVGYQGLMPLLSGRTDPDFSARYNAFFSLPSDAFDLERCERVRIHNLDQATVERYREQAAATGRPILLRALLPFAYTDEHPAAYRALRAVSPYRAHRPDGPVRVCIHLRRGDNLPDKRGRWLPSGYYLRVCGLVLETLRRQGAPFTVRIHTEVAPRQPVTIDPARSALEDFEALPNLETVFNAEPHEALDDFATADVLILSASSFGYLGGLLNPHGLVVFAPSTRNAPLPDWLVADQHGNLEPAEVATRVRALLASRNEALDGITTLEVSHGIGLTSCLSVRLQEVSKCRANYGQYPNDVDSSGQFQRYTDNGPQNLAELLLAPVRPMEDGPYIYFHSYHQFAWYRDLDLQALDRLARSYCWPSKWVTNEARSIMRSMQGRTAVLYRGNDKIREIPRTPYEKMFEMAELSKSQQFWVQTDEADFFDAFKARFPDTRRIEELPMIRRNDRAYVLPKTGRAEFAVKFLAALYAIAHAPQIICTTGNTALWPMIFRGHTRGVWQYYSRYDTYVGGEDSFW